jgi:transposase
VISVFIREYKDVDKQTGQIRIKHKLVSSIRTEKGPRQTIIMPLGTLSVPRIDWKRLAHALECRITGQQSLLESHDADLELLALKLVSNHKLSKTLEIVAEAQKHETQTNEPDRKTHIPIDVNSVRLSKTRGLGAELLCKKAWDMLGFGDILKRLSFPPISIALVMVLLFGRMISPGSERHTIEWFRKRSALQELEGVLDLTECGNDRFYEIADDLYANKEQIEDLLFQKEREYFPHSEKTIYLYDLTNTYLEGHGLNNILAARGHCKSKRYDCPLLTLALIVGDDGMPLCSEIYKGNQSEPETMGSMMERLLRRLHGSQIPMVKPTVAMDRGIATEDNVSWLRKNGYHYVVIKREDGCEEYRQKFELERELFQLAGSKKSIYDEDHAIYVRMEPVNEDISRVLCISEGKAKKERAIHEKKERPFLGRIETLRMSIQKGTIKKAEAIEQKLSRIFASYPNISKHYEASLVKTEGKITGVSIRKKAETSKPLFGCYVIETTHATLSATEIWKLYTTLTRVESAFRSMKETLGMRPVYHQTAARSSAHLFITVLAYHLLATLENILTQQDDTRTWGTVRDTMSTLVRGTVSMRDDQGVSYHLRLSGEPEDVHKDILQKLGIHAVPQPIISKIDTL